MLPRIISPVCRSLIASAFLIAAIALLAALIPADAVAAGIRDGTGDSNGGGAVVGTSPDGLWKEIQRTPAGALAAVEMIDRPLAYRTYQGNLNALDALLGDAPKEFSAAAGLRSVVITLPMPDGSYARFRIVESPILSPDLQAQHPELTTYMGQGLDDRTATVRFDRTPQGFHAQILSASGTVIVDPYTRGDVQHYISFWKSDLVADPNDFHCLWNQAEQVLGAEPIGVTTPSGTNLRTYRLAMTATGEYTTFFGGVAQAQAQITTTVNRIDGIYEREVSIRLNLVAFNIYANAATDPFPTGTSVDGNLLNQNQTDLDANVGSANYDIGHIVSQGGSGGLAQFGVCAGNKAKGGTSRGNPTGDAFDVDFVAHEMGHQFHGDHTFNGTTGSCGGGNRVASSAYEPGSGTTIMAYAGICGAEDVQPHSDPFFHTRSFDQIVAFREGGGTCGPSTATGNNPPAVNAGADYTIPQNTPFRLTASGSDPDGDALTFCWEQFDLGDPSPPANNANGPLFRSPVPTVSPTRVLPKMSTVLAGTSDPWEHLPTVNRDMNFRCTARDNRMGGGGVNYDGMVVHVSGSPFFVTSPNGGENLAAGCPVNVAWTVGGGSVAANVDILYSKDGGNTFSTLLAGTPNDGSESVTFPCNAGTTQGRIMVQGSGNIFFDVSNGNFTVSPAASSPPVATANAVGGAVDGSCMRTVTFDGTVHDDCSVNAAAVTILVTLPSANATLGVPSITKTQVDAQNVSYSGSVVVSNLAGPPATVQVAVNAQDGCGVAGTASTTTSVFDNTPPVIACPVDLTIECSSHCGPSGGVPATDPMIVAFLAAATATDNCDPSPTVGAVSPPACFPLGDTPVTFMATDKAGNSSTCSATVHVVDTTPPVIAVSLDRTVLWPPNHKMVTINATATVTDICDPNPTFQLLSIVSSEPVNALGDGNTSPDIAGADYGTADTQFQLRAERSGLGNGRKYTITYRAFDHSGNHADGVAVVRVPHDQGSSAIAADGWNADGTNFAPGATTFALVIRSVPFVAVDDGGISDVQASGGSQPTANDLLFSARAVDATQAYVGNTAGALAPVSSYRLDVNNDGYEDLVCFYKVADAQALEAISALDDGPIGLHFNTHAVGGEYLVSSIFGLGAPIKLPDLGVTAAAAVAGAGMAKAGPGTSGSPDETLGPHAAPAAQAPAAAPQVTELAGIYPNPSRDGATVAFNLAREEAVDLSVYDVRGARVRTLRSGTLGAGRYQVRWDRGDDGGRRLPGGMYFVRFSAGRYLKTSKAVMMP